MRQSPGRFGDRRPEKAGADLLARLLTLGPSGARVRAPGGDRAGEVRFGRFSHNPRVTPEEMIATAGGPGPGAATTPRADGDRNSLHLHAMIAVDVLSGASPGPPHAEFLRREGGMREQCGKRPFEEKQGFRWLAATGEAAKSAAAGAARVTVVADRECDIRDEFALRPEETELLIRVHRDRVLAGGRYLFGRTLGLARTRPRNDLAAHRAR